MSGAVFLPNKSFNLTVNLGQYESKTAVSGQLGFLVNDSFAINAGVATSFSGAGGTAARVGFTFGW